MDITTDEITLSNDQQNGLDRFVQFLFDPDDPYFVLRGYSGTGKSTLIATLLERLPSYIETSKLIDPDYKCPEVVLTATTHKAAENLSNITGKEVCTIHSFLGLRLDTDYQTGKKSLVVGKKDQEPKEGYLIFIDEASQIGMNLIGLLFQQTKNCKIVFMGDPAQLLEVGSYNAPVFNMGYTEVRLSETMRQMVNGVPMENAITALATQFRHTVETGKWPEKVIIDGEAVIWMPREKFNKAIEEEFTRPDWKHKDSKILAWTNETVINYNKYIRSLLKGDPLLTVGDYAEVNSYVRVGKDSLQTDATVLITEMEPDTYEMGALGNWVTLNHKVRVFFPRYRAEKNKLANKLRANEMYSKALEVDNWVDLRAIFSQTINKSQGSTYGKVYIDLDDIKKCNIGNLIARLLYVGISRGRYQCILTGDLV